MSNGMEELYGELLIEHSRSPQNYGTMASPSASSSGNNPVCGDAVTVFLDVSDGIINDIRFDGQGCAICIASTSMMTDLVKGKSLEEGERLFDLFRRYMLGEDVELKGELEVLMPLSGVRNFPIRIKCATLGWHVLHSALEESNAEKTENKSAA